MKGVSLLFVSACWEHKPIHEAEGCREDTELLGSAKATPAVVPRAGDRHSPMHRQGWVQGGSAPMSQHREADSPPRPRAGTALGTAPSQPQPGQGTSDDLSWHRELSWGHTPGQGQGSGLCSGSQLPSLHRALTHSHTSVTLHGVLHSAHGNTHSALGGLHTSAFSAELPLNTLTPSLSPKYPDLCSRPGLAVPRARGWA